MLYLDDMLDLPDIVPCRGRASQRDTNIAESFTADDLDQIAPLERGDSREFGEDRIPSSEVIVRIAQRIEAARRLKYGS